MPQPTNRNVSRQKPASLLVERPQSQIESCEQRLALSASLAGEILLDALDFQPQSAGAEAQQPSTDFADSADSESLTNAVALPTEATGLDGSGQTIAVIDTGIAWDHVALGGGFGPGYRVVGGWDFAENDANPYDDGPVGFHGTHVAGLLAGQTDDFQGIVSGADLVGLRVFDDFGNSDLQWVESALQWVHDNQDSFDSPITTVNLSIGAILSDSTYAEASAALADEFQLLRDDGILVFAAAGNFYGTEQAEGNNEILFPASDPNVVAVSSVNSEGALSDFAQREAGILATNGEGVRSSVPDHVFGVDGNIDDFADLDGTSMATPQAAGASVLVRQALIQQGLNPTAEEVLARLRELTDTRVDPDTGDSYSEIDFQRIANLSSDLVESDSVTQDSTVSDSEPIDRFVGESQSENAVLDLRDGISLQIDGETYSLAAQGDAPIVIDVGGGADSIQIIGSESAERLFAYPTTQVSSDNISVLSTNEFRIQLRGFEEIRFDGGGGPDSATLFDSPADDTLTSETNETTLKGTGFQFDVVNVDRVYVHGTAGGNDTAFLHDSAADDTLSVRPQFTSLRSDSTFQAAYGFERVYAYANNGGNDSATIHDSAGDDTLSVSPTRSLIAAAGYQVSASGFDSVTSISNAGGNDIANIYTTGGENQWHTTDDLVQWTGKDDAVRIARGFERVNAFQDYEPVSLQTLSVTNLIAEEDERKERALRESEAMRSIFNDLGSQSDA